MVTSVLISSAVWISIHALLAESDPTQYAGRNAHTYFYPRSPCGERPRPGLTRYYPGRNFYPRSPCGERRGGGWGSAPDWRISIHALLAESDTYNIDAFTKINDFYPRSPCGERPIDAGTGFFVLDISIHALLAESDGFLRRHDGLNRDFYPRSPCGERLCVGGLPTVKCPFLSTLSLRRATQQHNGLFGVILFLSTLSLRRAT